MEWSGWNRTIALLLLLGAASCGGESPPPSTSGPGGGGERISGTERLGWSQSASNTSELATFRYAAYVDGNRAELGDVSCGGASAPFACSSRMPQMAAGSHSLELVTFVIENGTVVESGRSAALRVTMTGATASGPGAAPAPALPLSTKLIATSDGAELRADVIADQLTAPTSLASSPDGRLFVAERDGRIRIIRGGALEAQPAITIYEALATAAGDGGLVGIALDREFEQTHFLYAVYTVSGPEATRVFRVVRYREVDGRLGERIVILDGVAAAAKPAAAIAVGPDGNLYVAFDAGQGSGRVPSASYSGKVLRLSPDGTTPKDQAGGPVLASDFVSPRGLDWNAETGTLWVVDAKTRDAEELRIVGARGVFADAEPFAITATLGHGRVRAGVLPRHARPGVCGQRVRRRRRGAVPPAPARRCARPVEGDIQRTSAERSRQPHPRRHDNERGDGLRCYRAQPCCAWGRADDARLLQMLDQQHLVPLLVVDELVDDLPHDQHAEAAGTEAVGGAFDGGLHHVLRLRRR